MIVLTNNEKQALESGWLDTIVEPHPEQWPERQRLINEARGKGVRLNAKQAQAQRVWDFVRLVGEGKLASAAHVRKEWLKCNPWVNGEEAALQARQRKWLKEHNIDISTSLSPIP